MALSSSTYPPPADLHQALRAEQLRLIFETQPLNGAASLAIAAIVAVTLLPVADPLRILLWGGVMVASNTFRIAVAISWRRDPERLQRPLHWRRYLFVTSLIGGAGWGLCNFLLFPAQNPSQQILLVFITCGISAAAAVSLAADRRIAWSFLLPCVLPLQWQLYVYSSHYGASLIAMSWLYLLCMAGVIVRLHNYIRDNILLRLAEAEREKLQNEFAQALHSSQEKLQTLFDSSPLGCVLLRTDGTIVEANRAFEKMFGHSIRDAEGNLLTMVASTPRIEEETQRWHQLIENGGTDTGESELVRYDGSTIPISLHRIVFDAGDGQHYVWSQIEDISERKRSEEQLLALNNRLSLATQAGGIGVWELDVVNSEVVWDARMCEIYGIDPPTGHISPELPSTLVHPDDWEQVMTSFVLAMENTHTDHHISEYRIVSADDTQRYVRTAGMFRRDAAGRALRAIGVAWDITDVKRVERMKSEFLSTVSHELRTPLTSIRGSLGLVASGVAGELPTAARDLIDVAYKNSERLSVLINDILDIEKIESGKMRLDLQRQSLRPLIEQSIVANQGFAQNFSVHLTPRIEVDATVVVDAHRFMQVMANLISNAVKFSNANDSVEIAAVDAPACVRIEVRDRGPGIPADFRERIFQRFSQADASDTRTRGGSGLGLAITKTFVEKMHGEIGFTERAGGGTVFFVELPRQ